MNETQDWFSQVGMPSIEKIMSETMENVYREENAVMSKDLKDILNSLKEDRPDIVHKYMKYLKD